MPDPPDLHQAPHYAPPRLVLASQSPRRQQLLDAAGFAGRYAALDPPYRDPDTPPGSINTIQDAESFVADTARRKAESLAEVLIRQKTETTESIRTLVLAADTTCLGPDGQLHGKPTDRAAALDMLRGFVDQTHAVTTGLALLAITRAGASEPHTDHATITHREHWADTTQLSWGPVDHATLRAYVDTDAWVGKAGAYNLTDRLDAGWPIAVQGDPTTVEGLPMRRLIPRLAALGVEV